MIAELTRLARHEDPARVPRAVDGETGMFVVDATWGVIQPMSLAPGVRTVGELEVIEHLRARGPVVDCRLPEYVERGTIPGAVNIPHGEIAQRIDEFDPVEPTIVFCNGPQCTATAHATDALLAAGWPPERLLYYRGGIHDWVTLGLPLARPQAD
jgi:rhodanese-related sulfurtransferase